MGFLKGSVILIQDTVYIIMFFLDLLTFFLIFCNLFLMPIPVFSSVS